MSNLAINDAGEAMYYDGSAWKPSQIAMNERGEKMAYDGKGWQRLGPEPSLGRKALDAAGEAASAVGDFAGRATDYVKTQEAKGFGGLAGVPRAALDTTKWAASKLGVNPYLIPMVGPAALALDSLEGTTGKKVLPTGEDASKFMLERAHANPAFTERSINPVVDAGAQALLTGPALGVGGRSGPLINMLGGMGSEAGGELAKGTPYEIPARVAGAVAGGGLGAGIPMALGKGAQIGNAVMSPFTANGRDTLVGNALHDQAADPAAAISKLENYQFKRDNPRLFPDAVPSFKIDAGKASRDPGLMAAADAAGSANPLMRSQVQINNAELTAALDRAAKGLPPAGTAGETIQNILGERFKNLQDARSSATSPLYDAARNFPEDLRIGPLFKFAGDTIASTKGEPQQAMKKVEGLLRDSQGRPDWSASGAMAARDAVGDMLDSPNTGKFTKSLLMEMKSKLNDALGTVPEEAAARTKFAEMSKPLDPFNADLGNKTVADVIAKDKFSKGYLMPSEKVPSTFMKGGDLSGPTVQKLLMAAGGDPRAKQALASAYIADFKNTAAPVAQDAAGNPMLTAAGTAKWLKAHEGGAAHVLTPDQLGALRDISKHLSDQAQQVPGRVGSQTFDRLATTNILSALISPKFADAPFLHPIRKALGLAYGGANEAALNRLYEVIADPAMTAALMKKATPGNVKMAEPVLKSISLQAVSPAERDSP